MTKQQDWRMRITFALDDIKDYEPCKEHSRANVFENFMSCLACKRDHLLLNQLRGLSDLFRDTEMQRERAEDCIKALKRKSEK